MLSITLQRLYEYFGIPEIERIGLVKKNVEYIARLFSDLDGDDTFRLLAKYDFDGSSIDRLNGVWKKIRYGEISKELVQDLRGPQVGLPQGVDGKTVVESATESVSKTASLPAGVSVWSI